MSTLKAKLFASYLGDGKLSGDLQARSGGVNAGEPGCWSIAKRKKKKKKKSSLRFMHSQNTSRDTRRAQARSTRIACYNNEHTSTRALGAHQARTLIAKPRVANVNFDYRIHVIPLTHINGNACVPGLISESGASAVIPFAGAMHF